DHRGAIGRRLQHRRHVVRGIDREVGEREKLTAPADWNRLAVRRLLERRVLFCPGRLDLANVLAFVFGWPAAARGGKREQEGSRPSGLTRRGTHRASPS